MKKMFLIILED